MKKAGHIIRIILFLAVFGLCFHYIERVFRAKDSEELSPYYYDYDNDTFDVIVAGSSVSKNGIQPVQLWVNNGIAAYNLSNGNQSLACSWYLLQDAVEKDHPKLIVLDVTYAEDSSIVRSNSFIHYLTDEMPLTDRFRLQMIRDLVPEDQKMEFYWPFYSYHTRWKELTASDFQNGTYQKDTLGAVSSARTMSLDVPLFTRTDTDDTLPDVSREYMEKIIALCREHNTPLLLICCPVAADNGGDVSEGDFNRRRSIMKQISEIASSENITFLNFLEDDSALGLDPYNDYKDGVHLNIWGSAKLTSYLGSYIREHYDIPDRTSDPEYSEIMNRMVPRYEKVLQQRAFTTTSRVDTEFKVLQEQMNDDDLLYLICGQDFNGSSEELSDTIRDGLTSLGLSYDMNYNGLTNIAAVIDSGTVLHSEQNVIADDVDYILSVSGMKVELKTNAMNENPDLHHNNIYVRGGNYAPAEDGLCIAVADKSTHKVIDCVTLRYDGSGLTHFTEAGN